MTPTSLIDPTLLEKYALIRSAPSWNEVKDSMKRLAPLREEQARPYDQMGTDRSNVLRYAEILRSSADSITYGVCLAVHLAQFSKAQLPKQKLEEGFEALKTGLDLPALVEADRKQELERCFRLAFPDEEVTIIPLRTPSAPSESGPAPAAQEAVAEPTGTTDGGEDGAAAVPSEAAVRVVETSSKPQADAWREALKSTVVKIEGQDAPKRNQVIERASDSWQARLLRFLTETSQPAIPPDIDYLRCRAANDPLGTVLRGRLKDVSLREWNQAYVSGMSTDVKPPVPLWFALAALVALGFDVPRDFSSAKPAMEAGPATDFVSKIPPPATSATELQKGLLILRLPKESLTEEWKISPSMPALILPPVVFLQDGKLNLQSYFQERLYWVLIEVARNEQWDAVQKRADVAKIREKLPPNVKIGYLLPGPNELARRPERTAVAVNPSDASEAYSQAFPSPSPSSPPTSAR